MLSDTPVHLYSEFSQKYWKQRALDAERELERVTDELDSANERIQQLEQARTYLKGLLTS